MMMSRNTKLIAVFIAMLVVGVLIWQTQNIAKTQSINSFEECAAAGYPIMESYPERCSTPDGRAFTRDTSTQAGWQEQTIEEIGLTFQIPPDTMLRKESSKEGEPVRKVVFFIQKGSDDNPDYMLYGLYQRQPDRQATKEVDIERWKAEMNSDTIKDTAIDQYVGVEGFINGKESEFVSDRTRYARVVLKDGGVFSISTLPPTEENKELTEKIIETFNFK